MPETSYNDHIITPSLAYGFYLELADEKMTGRRSSRYSTLLPSLYQG